MAYVIDITARTGRAGTALTKLETVVQRLEKSLDKAAAAMDRFASASARVGAISPMGGPPARRGGGASPQQLNHGHLYNFYRARNLLNGGYGGQMLSAARGAFGTASAQFAGGNFGAAGQMATWAARIRRLQGSGSGSAIGKWLASSRFGVGANGVSLQPLVGQSIAMLAKLGPHGMVAAAALAAVALAAIAAKKGFDKLVEMTGTKFATGSTFGEAAKLSAIGTYLGGDIAGRVNSFQDAIGSGGYAAAYAGQAGINVVGGPFGDRNYGRKYLKYLDAVYNAKSNDTADRMSMAVGQRDMQRIRMLDPETYQRLKNSMGDSISAKSAAAAEKAKAEMAIFSNELDKFATMMARSVIPVLTKSLRWINDMLDRLLSNRAFATALGFFFGGGAVGAAMMHGASEEYLKSKNIKVDENTKALNENTRALGQFREVIGGGQRAQNSLPGKATGKTLNNDAMRMALAGGLI